MPNDNLMIPPPTPPNPIYMNDHIWIDTQGNNVATANQPSTLYVQVARKDNGQYLNVGEAVTTQMFVCVPGFGVGAISYNLASAGGQPGHSSTKQVQAGPPIVPIDFSSPINFQTFWTPTTQDQTQYGNHVCIAANVYDTTTTDGNALTSGLIQPLGTDQHQAQLNISIVPAPHRMASTARLFFFIPAAEYLPPEAAKLALVRVTAVEGERVLAPVVRERILATAGVTLMGGKPTPEANRPSACLDEPRERIRLRGGGELVLANTETRIHRAEQPVRQVVLSGRDETDGDYRSAAERGGAQGAERRYTPLTGMMIPVTAAFDVPNEPGGVHEFDIVLQTGNTVVGGMRAVLVSGLD
jgi:hypothetical protein